MGSRTPDGRPRPPKGIPPKGKPPKGGGGLGETLKDKGKFQEFLNVMMTRGSGRAGVGDLKPDRSKRDGRELERRLNRRERKRLRDAKRTEKRARGLGPIPDKAIIDAKRRERRKARRARMEKRRERESVRDMERSRRRNSRRQRRQRRTMGDYK